MSAAAWYIFAKAKKYLMSGDIDLNTNSFRLSLFTSASNVALSASNLSVVGQITSEVATAFGYAAGGRLLSAVTWTVGASANEERFDCTAKIFTAIGGDIIGVKYALISVDSATPAARKLLCYSQLSSNAFVVTNGNTLTITPSANGIFELN
jgi:hypothetical protein